MTKRMPVIKIPNDKYRHFNVWIKIVDDLYGYRSLSGMHSLVFIFWDFREKIFDWL
jgi:hypothetical protein